ncbi:gamma-glutamyltransferase [Cognatishimia sp. SS12]|uniref:gamma-glutamyltransferase n=1 Tax=Cognatishimia sp. SS12 TaxID=2979465 RepID=UPI00233041B0|nr:gamma-glutamyltransferase [Cognatishimia sp. SS12]MDC0737936.1 gamma-glutamyltransferase [Cognatishimia sp. SS12]
MRDLHLPGRSAVWASNAMCATSHPLAAQVAVDIMKRGGNAMDAAIAGAVILGLCEPQMTGIGGDCFVLFSPAGSDDILAMNGSGVAPAAADAEALRSAGHDKIPAHGTDSVTIPTAVDCFCQLSDRWGRLGISDLLAPAITYAEAGVPVAERVAFDWGTDQTVLKPAAQRFYLNNGAPFKTGELFRAPKQAEALRKIAAQGRDGFYKGDVADDMVRSLAALGGVHTLDDFAAAKAIETTPIQGHYKAHDLFEHPPNGQGAIAILLLNILKQFDLASLDPMGAKRVHIEAEATKLAYDLRNQVIGDPSRAADAEALLSEETAQKLAAQIDLTQARPAETQIHETVHKDTVYITVVDRDGMMVSLIYSIFNGFGSGIASEDYGILLHNRGAGFSLTPGHPNEYGPGRRPLHTIIPGMLAKDGAPIMPFGVMGGQYQAAGHARLLSNMLDFDMSPQAAIDAPRAFAEKGQLKLERGFAPDVAQALADLGHDIVVPDPPIGGAQAILRHDSGVLEGGSDPRKDGCALGY